MMKYLFWIMAGVSYMIFSLMVNEAPGLKSENADLVFLMTFAFAALGYLAGIYERLGNDEE